MTGGKAYNNKNLKRAGGRRLSFSFSLFLELEAPSYLLLSLLGLVRLHLRLVAFGILRREIMIRLLVIFTELLPALAEFSPDSAKRPVRVRGLDLRARRIPEEDERRRLALRRVRVLLLLRLLRGLLGLVVALALLLLLLLLFRRRALGLLLRGGGTREIRYIYV